MEDLINSLEVDSSYGVLLSRIEEYGLNLSPEDINSIYQKFLDNQERKKFIPADQLMEITIMETMIGFSTT